MKLKNQLSIDQKEICIALHKDGINQRKISQILKCNQSTVSRIIKNYRNRGIISRKVGSGRKSILNRVQKLRMKRLINQNPQLSTHQIIQKCDLFNLVSVSTVSRYLRFIGLYSRVAAKSSIINKIQKRKRLFFAQLHLHKNKEFWNNIYFTDETTVKLSPRWRIIVRRPKNTKHKKRYVFKYVYSDRRSIMFWGFIRANGERFLTHIDGTMNSTKYIETLKKAFPVFNNNCQMQQDRATCHYSHLTMNFFNSHNIQLLQFWPPNSPDLNPIENIWGIVKNKMNGITFKTIEECKQQTSTIFNSISADIMNQVCSSMPARINEVIRNKGGKTKY